jgi:hypothetical protein
VAITIRRRDPPKREQFAAAEAQLGIRIPGEYRRLLALTDGGKPLETYFSAMVGLNEFLGIQEIVERRSRLGDRLPRTMLPIGAAEGGNLVCIAVRGPDAGTVWFWDHELEDSDRGPFEKLAGSFNDFVRQLRKPPPLSEAAPKAMASWVDPEFDRQIKERQRIEETESTVVFES